MKDAIDIRQCLDIQDEPRAAASAHPPIVEQANTLSVLISDLDKALAELEERLSPVSRPALVTKQDTDQDTPPSNHSGLFSHLFEQNSQLRYMQERISSILGRLEM